MPSLPTSRSSLPVRMTTLMRSNTDMCTAMKPAAKASANVPGANPSAQSPPPPRKLHLGSPSTHREISAIERPPRSQANRGTSGFRLSQVATGCQQAACDQRPPRKSRSSAAAPSPLTRCRHGSQRCPTASQVPERGHRPGQVEGDVAAKTQHSVQPNTAPHLHDTSHHRYAPPGRGGASHAAAWISQLLRQRK